MDHEQSTSFLKKDVFSILEHKQLWEEKWASLIYEKKILSIRREVRLKKKHIYF